MTLYMEEWNSDHYDYSCYHYLSSILQIKINAFTVENVQKPARWRRFNAVSEENHRQLQQLLKLGLLIKIGGGQWNLKIHFRDGKYNIVIG